MCIRDRSCTYCVWLKSLNLLLSHLSSDLCTVSRSTNALNINSFHLPTKFSQPANLITYTILSMFSLQVEPAPHQFCCHPSSTICIFVITNHQPLLYICITSPLESTTFFIPSTLLCSLSSWLTSSYAYHLITVITFVLNICHSLDLSLQT